MNPMKRGTRNLSKRRWNLWNCFSWEPCTCLRDTNRGAFFQFWDAGLMTNCGASKVFRLGILLGYVLAPLSPMMLSGVEV